MLNAQVAKAKVSGSGKVLRADGTVKTDPKPIPEQPKGEKK